MNHDKGKAMNNDISARSRAAEPGPPDKEHVQGEGDYKSARKFNEAERKFVASGQVAAAARAAAPNSEAERQAMLAAEQEGKSRAKEEDPALTKARPDSAIRKVPKKGSGR